MTAGSAHRSRAGNMLSTTASTTACAAHTHTVVHVTARNFSAAYVVVVIGRVARKPGNIGFLAKNSDLPRFDTIVDRTSGPSSIVQLNISDTVSSIPPTLTGT